LGNSYEKTVADEIEQVKPMAPHLVILGAGASRAAFPDGDALGNLLPLMEDFIDIVPIKHLLEKNGIHLRDRNFEEIYSDLTTDQSMNDICSEIQTTIYDYFSSFSLPSTPTIYDHLLLSLRSKDVVATFNWDPFLIRAYRRNYGKVESLPKLLFLHGNVLAAFCKEDRIVGVNGGRCSKCGRLFTPSHLLYPVKNKDYKSDPQIKNDWEFLEYVLKHAFIVTIFGYSAPTSDAAALEILSDAWGKPEERQFEEIEIIDLKDNETLRNNWRQFIHTHHYTTTKDFYNSWISNHPRRTIESCYDQTIEALFIENHPIPKNASFPELWEWFSPLNEAEKRAKVEDT
jgi:hypothetical protein